MEFLSTKVMDRAGVLCTLRFNQAQRPKEYECSLDLSDWSLKLDCRYQSLIPGRITTVGKTLSVKETSARTYSLTQNYPNPFSESTTIELKITDYSLQILDRPNLEETDVRNPQSVILKFYDLFGSEVLDLSDEARMNSSVMIHASQLPGAGMYFYRLSANGISQTKIMVNQ